jgi:Uma2 family endonuclease
MFQTLVKSLSIDEFLKLPETKPACELIDGVVIAKPSPQGKHSTIQLDLGSSINLALKPQRIARAYSELRCKRQSENNRSFIYLKNHWDRPLL